MSFRWSLRSAAPGLLLAAASLLACRGAEPSTPPLTRRVAEPLAFVPRDLDVVFRVEPARFRAAFPELAFELDPPSVEPNVFWSRAFAVARVLVLGLRWSPELVPLDGVLVATGVTPEEFETLLPRREFHAAIDLGRGWYRYDARSCPKRTSVCRVYYSVSEVLVAASLAELDAVERTVEGGVTGTRLEPEGGGVLGVAATASALTDALLRDGSKASKFLEQARGFRARLDVLGGRVLLGVESEWGTEERAARAREAFELYLELERRRRSYEGVEFEVPEVQGMRVLVRLSLPRSALVFR